MMPLSVATIALSSFLLFQIQPMIARMILPWFGGSAAVWVTAMLFFQAMLLGGYLYAHWSVGSLKPRSQAVVHAVLLAASFLFLPIVPSLSWKPAGSEDPIMRILGLLLFSVGLPYFLLSSTSPLVQAWYSRRHEAALPYRLFALSNLASLAGLLAYPVLIEPSVTLRGQSLAWSAGYTAFALLAGLSAFRGGSIRALEHNQVVQTKTTADDIPTVRERFLWFLLAACASTLLLAVTNHLTQNVASIPFLWVLPLSLYLLSFILTFDFERLYNPTVFRWMLIAALGWMAYGLKNWNSHTGLRLVIPAFSAGLFLCCMYCHGELVRRKPAPRYLTSFYLMLSLGGAAGGLLVGFVAPKTLPGYFELPIALAVCAVLMLFLLEYRQQWLTFAAGAGTAVALTVTSFIFISDYRASALVMMRNFYGGLRVNQYDTGTGDENRILVHGTVDHGVQFTQPGRRKDHITYYGPESGIGLAIKALRHSPLRVGVIGLGAGSIASFAQPGDVFRFYDINPLVEQIARTQFTYLSDSRGRIEIVLGDGRLSLERETSRGYDILAVDAFSGDAVPVHLLTRQAVQLYFRHLKPNGILALHITNTHLDLAPVVELLRADLGKYAVLIENDRDDERKIYHSTWALLSSTPITSPVILDVADELPRRPELRVWTDDYNNLFKILK